jgi:hypothetical protein
MEQFEKNRTCVMMYGMPNKFVDYCEYYGIKYCLQTCEVMEDMSELQGVFQCVPVEQDDLDPQLLQKAARLGISVLRSDGFRVPPYCNAMQHERMIQSRIRYFTERSRLILSKVKYENPQFDMDAVEVMSNVEAHYVFTHGMRMFYVSNLEDVSIRQVVEWLLNEPQVSTVEQDLRIECEMAFSYASFALAAQPDTTIIAEPVKMVVEDGKAITMSGKNRIQTLAIGIMNMAHVCDLKRDVPDVVMVTEQFPTAEYIVNQDEHLPDYYFHNVQDYSKIRYDLVLSLQQIIPCELVSLLDDWFRSVYRARRFPTLKSQVDVGKPRFRGEWLSPGEVLKHPALFVAHARSATYSPNKKNFIGLMAHDHLGFRESLGVFTESQNILIVVPKAINILIRTTYEQPAAIFCGGETTFSVIIARITNFDRRYSSLAHHSKWYNFYEIAADSLDVDEMDYDNVPLTWINVVSDGKWFASRPIIVGKFKNCVYEYDPNYYARSDICELTPGYLHIKGYEKESRHHVINSRIIM